MALSLLTRQDQCQRMFLLSSSKASVTSRVELRQLEHFIAVAEELGFTRAARRLHVVQSGVSAAIRSLERDLGGALFERTSQQVRLTGAGAALLPEARATLHAAQAAQDAVRAAQDTLRGTVNVGAMASVEVVDLPALLGQLHARHPAIDVGCGWPRPDRRDWRTRCSVATWTWPSCRCPNASPPGSTHGSWPPCRSSWW
ncbi:LysR family transcriptional regulator [Streptomyces sp. NPDC048521]|uniref:LysR family transcriptional regulator n=1 Tax=Streptomyces sp. NPDC048521 TaxID=3365566 RepID=UPI0037195ECD